MHKYLSNIHKYFQGRDDGSFADGNSGGLSLLPLHQDHCQLLRGCPSKHQQMMIIVNVDCFWSLDFFVCQWSHMAGKWLCQLWKGFAPLSFLSASGPMWMAHDCANSEKALALWALWVPSGRQIIVSTVKSRWSWAGCRYWQTFQTCYNLSQIIPLSPTHHWWSLK